MKRMLRWLGGLVLILALLAVWAFWPVRLAIAPLAADLALPSANPPADMALYALPTGVMHSQAMFAFRGGRPGEARDFGMTAFLVRHPRGDLLIDSGLGREVAAHYARLPPLMRMSAKVSPGRPAAQQLEAAGIAPDSLAAVLLTHAHWDHVSGLPDLPGVPVWLPQDEQDFIHGQSRMTELARSMGDLVLRPIRFEHGAYLGYARSHDVWGDGSVVIVPAPGHTPGSVIVFVTLPDAQRYAFVGDIVWQLEGITRPAERPWPSRRLVDLDADAVRTQIAHLAALHARFPAIRMVPAHDARAAAGIPVLSR
jgi:N-acyl homoserine lactone hydrolase